MRNGFTLFESIIAVSISVILLAAVLSALLTGKQRAASASCSGHFHSLQRAMSLYASDYDSTFPPITTAVFRDHHAHTTTQWGHLVLPYLKDPHFPRCPSLSLPENLKPFVQHPASSGYAINGWLSSEVKLSNLENHLRETYTGKGEHVLEYPTLTITLLETRAGIIARRSPDTSEVYGIFSVEFVEDIKSQPPGARRHAGGANYGFADGHVKWFKPEQVSTAKHNDGIHPGFGL